MMGRAGIFLLAVGIASPDIRYFQFERPLVSSPTQGGQACLTLDPEIFAHAAPQLADLRLYRENTETPYVIRVADHSEIAETSALPLNLGVRGKDTVFDVVAPKGNYNDLNLNVTAQNFIATVTVSGSLSQGVSAETKIGTYNIFDLTREKLGRSTVLHLPESNFRYLNFRIHGPIAPDSVAGVSVVRLPSSEPNYTTVAESSQVQRKDHSSMIEFTVPAGVPVDRVDFTLGAAPANYSRDVRITVTPLPRRQETDEAEPPQPVISYGNLLRIHREEDGHQIDEDRRAIEVPRVDFNTPTKWTISIDNGDDVPLLPRSVRLQMLARTLCFESVANARYWLFYGDAALQPPHYDYATLFTPQSNAAQIATGPEQPNSEFHPRPDNRPFTEKHPALLWAALVLVITLLGAIALRTTSKTARTI
jgi:hypothetical protein